MPFLGSKYAKITFAAGTPLRIPLGELIALPQTPYSWIKGPTSKGRGGKGRRRKGMEGKVVPSFSNSWIRPCVLSFCLSSAVTSVHHTQRVELFDNILHHLIAWGLVLKFCKKNLRVSR